MGAFVGWSPTITGRVAFSRVADDPHKHPEICNLSAWPDGFLFGVETRTSPDGPVPAWILRRWRVPDQVFVLFLDIAPAELPRPSREKDCAVPIELFNDQRGCLKGEIYFFSKSKLSKTSGAEAILNQIRHSAVRARSPGLDEADKRHHYSISRQAAADLFDTLRQQVLQGIKTPAFARARLELGRTGRCLIELNSGDLLVNKATKLAHRSGLWIASWAEQKAAFDQAAGFIARQAFNVLRSLSHRHYHHHQHADLLATTYPWTPTDDQTWRRETQYGLARMAIEIRRRGTAKAFKQCAGVVAYAESFQLHLCGWFQAENGSVQPANEIPPYDFAALKGSIDASLKVQELDDAERRQTILYLTTIFLAALVLVVGGVRAPSSTSTSGPFVDFLTWTTASPIQTLAGALFAAWWIDLAWLRAALPLPATRVWYYGLKRATKAAMGSLMWRGVGDVASYTLALFGLLAVIALFAGLSALAMFLAYYTLDVT